MAKDDYEVIVYKILLYLYARLKGNITFDQIVYDKAIGKEKLNDGYLERIYKMMQNDGLIEGYIFTDAWGQTNISLISDHELQITSKGIAYLKENSRMNKVKQFLKDKADFMAELIGIVGL